MGAQVGCAFCKDKTPVLDVNDKVNFLKAVKLFQQLTEDDFAQLADACFTAIYPKGTIIYHQGDYGAELYVIASGQVAVSVEGNKIAYELTAGDYFGENALLRDCPRTVSVTTEQVTQVVRVTRKVFQDMEFHKKLQFEKRPKIQRERSELVECFAPSEKSEDDVSLLLRGIRSNENLMSIADLDDEQCQFLCDSAWERTVMMGEKVITQGDVGDYFYIVKAGMFEKSISVGEEEKANSCADLIESHFRRLGKKTVGDSFGEKALLLNVPRQATVTALEDSVLWVLDRNTFKKGAARKADHYAKRYSKYLAACPSFSCLDDEERMSVAKALLESNFSKGEYIFTQGDDGTSFYILYEGEVTVTMNGAVLQDRITCTPESVEMFGDTALINGDPYAATVEVVSDTAKALSMDKDSFEMLLGPVAALNAAKEDTGKTRRVSRLKTGGYAAAIRNARNDGHQQVFHNELETKGVLGCGAFGEVSLVQHKETKHTYALKSLSKGYVVQNDMKQDVLREKEIQLICDSDFIVRLYETYNDDQTLYLLLELGLGGELYHTYETKLFYGKEGHAKYYTAGVVFAFEHMHRKKVIYRDLKPENILMNSKGHSKLTDMGLATRCIGKSYTACGTCPYMAPEVITSKGHNHAVDWWMLGILTYELMTHHTPFEAQSQDLIFSKIQRGINAIKFPANTSSELRNYVRLMCKSDPAERLAMKKGGAENIKNHKWYAGFDWAAMKNLKMPPPYVPKVASNTDLGNFREKKEDTPPHVEYKDDGTGWDEDFATSPMVRPASDNAM